MSLYHRMAQSLRQSRSAIKSAFLTALVFFGPLTGPVHADFRQPCPKLSVTAACSPEGLAEARVKAPADLPQGLRLLISGPGSGGTYMLTGGRSVAVSLPGPAGEQVALTVVGLEGAGDTAKGCCFSSHRLRRPVCTVTPADPSPTERIPDFAVTLQFPETCPRRGCVGKLGLAGPAGPPQAITLKADGRGRFTAAACLGSQAAEALCDVPPGAGMDVTFVPDPAAPAGRVELCGQLGIGASDRVGTLALQKALARQGYDPGPLDGRLGPATRAALNLLAADAGLPPPVDAVPPQMLDLLGLSGFADANPANDRDCAQTNLPRRPSGGAKRATTGTADTGPACDPKTTALRGGVCQCRSKAMVRVSPTRCKAGPELRLCPNGLPEILGLGCPVVAPGCRRTNAAGECCDDLPADDASCR